MSKTYDQLTEIINWAMGFTFTIAAFLLSKDTLLELLREDMLLGILSIVLLIVTILLFFFYVRAVRNELDLLDTVFESEKVRPADFSGSYFLAILGVAAFFGFRISLVTNITYYTGVAIIFTILDMFGVSLVTRNFYKLHRDEKIRKEPLIKENVRILSDYYLGNPLGTRFSAMLLFEFIAFGLSIFVEEKISAVIVYLIVIITFVVGEIVMHSWRKTRDNNLKKIKEDQNKTRSDNKDLTTDTSENRDETKKSHT